MEEWTLSGEAYCDFNYVWGGGGDRGKFRSTGKNSRILGNIFWFFCEDCSSWEDLFLSIRYRWIFMKVFRVNESSDQELISKRFLSKRVDYPRSQAGCFLSIITARLIEANRRENLAPLSLQRRRFRASYRYSSFTWKETNNPIREKSLCAGDIREERRRRRDNATSGGVKLLEIFWIPSTRVNVEKLLSDLLGV